MPPIDPRASKKEADYSWQGQMLQPFHPLLMNIDQQIFPQPPILSTPGYSAPPPSTQSYFQSGISVTQGLYLHTPVPQTRYHAQIVNPNLLSLNPPTPNLIDPGTTSSTSEFTPNAGSSDPEQQVRVLDSRPKPQCWDHGCNGREFSNFSNLLRHQREKSGHTANAKCPGCGAVFTRTTNRNSHVSQGRCKGGRRERMYLIH